MPKKIKPAKRPGAKLVEGARDYVLNAYDTATGLLTKREQLDLITVLREDLDLRQSMLYAKGRMQLKIAALKMIAAAKALTPRKGAA